MFHIIATQEKMKELQKNKLNIGKNQKCTIKNHI